MPHSSFIHRSAACWVDVLSSRRCEEQQLLMNFGFYSAPVPQQRCRVLWWASLFVCLFFFMCISGTTHWILPNFLLMLPMVIAWSSFWWCCNMFFEDVLFFCNGPSGSMMEQEAQHMQRNHVKCHKYVKSHLKRLTIGKWPSRTLKLIVGIR